MLKLFMMVSLVLIASIRTVFAALEDKEFTIEDVIVRVLEHNPHYQSMQKKVDSLRYRAFAKSSWEEPQIGVQFDEIPTSQFMSNSNQVTWFAMQKFPFPGKLTFTGSAIKRGAQAEEARREAVKFQLLRDAKKEFYDLYYWYQAIAVMEEQKRIGEKFQKIGNQKYSVGKATQQDVLKAMIELSRLTNELQTAEKLQQGVYANLNALMNRPIGAWLGKPAVGEFSPLKQDIYELEKMAAEDQPEIKAADFDVQQTKKERLLASFSYFPDLFTRFEIMDNRDKEDDWMAEFGITVPFWFWHKQIPEVKEASAKVSESELKLRNTHNQVQSAIKSAFDRGLDLIVRISKF